MSMLLVVTVLVEGAIRSLPSALRVTRQVGSFYLAPESTLMLMCSTTAMPSVTAPRDRAYPAETRIVHEFLLDATASVLANGASGSELPLSLGPLI